MALWRGGVGKGCGWGCWWGWGWLLGFTDLPVTDDFLVHRASDVERWCVFAVCLIKLQHDDVFKWRHFPRYWPFVWGIHRSLVNSLHKGQWRGALIFSLICVWISCWVNNGEAGDLRRHRAHYDVTIMDRRVTCDLWGNDAHVVSIWWTQECAYHQFMMTSSNGNIFRVTGPLWGESTSQRCIIQRPVTRRFYVFFDLRLNKQLSKQSRRRWFETPSCPLLRHCNYELQQGVCGRQGSCYELFSPRMHRVIDFKTRAIRGYTG